VTEPGPPTLYERYRDALRVGHLASLRGNHAVAVRAYLEAAAILPERAAPYVGLGRTELAAGRATEALGAYGAALERASSDTAALDGMARSLLALDRPAEAADTLDRLAITLLELDRGADALAALERAINVAESRWRRAAVDRLRSEHGLHDAPWLGALPMPGVALAADAGIAPFDADRAGPRVAPGVVPENLRRLAGEIEAASAGGDVAGLVRGALDLARADRLRAAIDACHDALSVSPADPDVHRALATIYRRRGWEHAARLKARLVERYLGIVDDPHELDAVADQAEAGRDVLALLEVANRHAERGRRAAALELDFRALVIAPADPRVHLAIARLHLALGWRRRAVDEVARLARLVELTGDDDGRRRVAAFVNAELRPKSREAAAKS
jgi:tetratricopeptide (TPR) repeat protein